MTPDTVHFVAQMIRHHRAQATSFEKWVRKQPASPACREMLQVLAVYRGVLSNVEAQIEKFDVEQVDVMEDEDVRSGRQAGQPSRHTCGSPGLSHELQSAGPLPAGRK